MSRSRFLAFVVFVSMVMALVPLSQLAASTSTTVVISEFRFRGPNGGNDEFIELYNLSSLSQSIGGWKVNGSNSAGTASTRATISAGATIAPGCHYLLTNSNALAGPYSGSIPGDQTYTTGVGDDGGIALLLPDNTIVDQVGLSTGSAYKEGTPLSSLGTSNLNRSYERKPGGATGSTVDTDNNSNDFQVITPSDPQNRASCGGDTAPAVTATSPLDGAVGVGFNTTITVTFSEPVNVSSTWFTIVCITSGSHTAAQSGGPTTFTLDPTSDLSFSESCTVTVLASEVTDQDTVDPPNNMLGNYSFSFTTQAPPPPPTFIHDIQGAAHISPFNGQTLGNVPGIVTAKRTNGFYMQDPNADSDPATSEGIFVFTSSAPVTVSIGDAVSVSGRVTEFRPGGSASGNLTTTEIGSPTITVLSSGNALPAATVVGTGGRVPPNEIIEDDAGGNVETGGTFDPANDGIDFWESLEGMRIQLNDAVAVGPTNRFGETSVVGDDGANANIRTDRGGILLRPNDGNPERVVLDDSIVPLPLVNVGDHYSGPIIGVLDYNFGNFFLEVTNPVTRVDEHLAPEVTRDAGSHELTIATFNVENLDPGDGADKFTRLADRIVTSLKTPDLIGLEEVQDNNGATDNGVVDATTTLDTLVNAILNLSGVTYDYRLINPVNDQDGGEPGGNIRQAFLFRTDRGLAFVDRPGGDSTTATSVVSTPTGPQLSYSPGRIAPANTAWNSSRKPLAGEFTYNTHHLFVFANHFISKGGDQPLEGRFQPPTRSSEVQRHQQAQIEHDFVAQILALDPNADVVVVGDLNDFEFSDTVAILKADVLNDLYDGLPLTQRYSYVFEGNSQTLDHILVSDALKSATSFDVVHVNAEFADQVSDHDPSVAFLTLLDTTTPLVTAPVDVTVFTGAGAATCGTAVSDAALGIASATDDGHSLPTSRSGVPTGNLFPVGTTTITYAAVDAAGNSGTATQRVYVIDKTPPTISAPADAEYQLITDVPAGRASDATASDNCVTVTVTLVETNNGGAGSPASPLIITRTFTATDAAGNTASATQTITVRVTAVSLCTLTRRLVSKEGVGESLCAKLTNAAAARDRGNQKTAENILNAYINEVEAQRGKAIAPEDANLLILLATGL